MTTSKHLFEPVWTTTTETKPGYYRPGCTCGWTSKNRYETPPDENLAEKARSRALTDWYRNHKKKQSD